MFRSCVWLTLAVLLSLLVIGGAFAAPRGVDALLAASAAAGICWLGATAALVVSWFSNRSNRAVQGHLLGALFRLGLPLGIGLVFQQSGGRLAEAGVFGFIVVFYLVTLVAETLLSLRLIKRPQQMTRNS